MEISYFGVRNRGSRSHTRPFFAALMNAAMSAVPSISTIDVSAMSSVDFGVLLQRGTEWAATGAVTQKVPVNFPTATSVTYRSDLLAMDPAYWGPPK